MTPASQDLTAVYRATGDRYRVVGDRIGSFGKSMRVVQTGRHGAIPMPDTRPDA